MDIDCTLASNPDISGRGVRAAIYLQNLLCFFPAVWALWDGEVTEYELDSVETHSMTNLILAFAILVSCIVQALGTSGLSNYHASIILSMSWMNNTNAFIYFLLYVQYKTQEGVAPRWSAWRKHLKSRIEVVLHPFGRLARYCAFALRRFARRLLTRHPDPQLVENGRQGGPSKISFTNSTANISRVGQPVGNIVVDAAKTLFGRIAIVLGSLHLTLMASLGLWLWSAPQSFGTPDTDPECAFNFAYLTVLGLHIPFHSNALRIFSLTMYSLFLTPGINLLLPIVAFMWLHLKHRALYSALGAEDVLPEVAPHVAPPIEGAAQPFQSLRSRMSRAVRLRKAALSDFVKSSIFPAFVGLGILLIINIVFIVDIELTLRRNQEIQGTEESEWGFGQILAMLLLSMPLRDLVEAVFRRRQEMQTKLDNALRKAIDDGNIGELTRWFRAGADPNVRSDRTHRTALEAAALAEAWDTFQEIIEGNVDVNAPFADLRTALEAVTQGRQWHLFPALVDANAELNRQFSDGSGTALHAVCGRGPLETSRMLLERGADPNSTTTRYAESCLHTACSALREDIIQLLLEHGANPNSRDRYGRPALYAVCRPGHENIPIVILLLKHGTTPTPGCASGLRNIGSSLRHRSQNHQDASYLDEEQLVHKAALMVHPPGHADRAEVVSNFTTCIHSRPQQSTDDLNEALLLDAEVLDQCPLGHVDRAKFIENLAISHYRRSSGARDMADLEDAISLLKEALEERPPGHSDRVVTLERFVAALHTQEVFRGVVGTNDETIPLKREILRHRPPDHIGRRTYLMILAVALEHRFVRIRSLPDLDEAISLRREVIRHCAPGHADHGKCLLALADGLQWRSKEPDSAPSLDEAIQLKREALDHFPLDHAGRVRGLSSLAVSIHHHFQQAQSVDAIDEAISLERQAIDLHPPDSEGRHMSVLTLAKSLHLRAETFGSTADMDEAIRLLGSLYERLPLGHRDRPMIRQYLTASLAWRSHAERGVYS